MRSKMQRERERGKDEREGKGIGVYIEGEEKWGLNFVLKRKRNGLAVDYKPKQSLMIVVIFHLGKVIFDEVKCVSAGV